MIGKHSIILTYESVKEALQDYLNKHLAQSAQIDITKWDRDTSNNSYNAPEQLKVEFEPKPASESQ